MVVKRIAVLTVVATLIVPLAFASAIAEDLAVNDVLQMWSERQAELDAVEIHWIEKVSQAQNQSPAKPGEKSTKCSLWLGRGPSIRYQRDSVAGVKASGILSRPGMAVSAFNGKRNAYFTSAVGPDDHHRGIEFDAQTYDELPNYYIHPILFYYRPLLVVPVAFSSKDHVTTTPVQLRIVEQDAILDGTECLVIESVSNAPVPYTNRYWIDASKRGVILKHVASLGGSTKTEMRIKYKKHPEHGWMPSLWHGKFLGSSFDGIVTKVTIEGTFEEEETFVIDYPPGTVVFDQDQLQQRRVKKDGITELISPTP